MNQSLLSAIELALSSTLSLSDDTQVHENTKLKDDLGLDSMSTLSFLMALEENVNGFVVDPDTLDADHLDTVGSVMNYISNELARAA